MTAAVAHVVIIGGGVSGLTAAYAIRKEARARSKQIAIGKPDQFSLILPEGA